MAPSTITVPVDAATAEAYANASAEDKRKFELLLSLRLRELTEASSADLKVIMDQMASNAQARGLTPAILESFLHD